MKRQDITELIDDAIALFKDQPKEVGDLIYWAITLDDEARHALVLAYRILHDGKS